MKQVHALGATDVRLVERIQLLMDELALRCGVSERKARLAMSPKATPKRAVKASRKRRATIPVASEDDYIPGT